MKMQRSKEAIVHNLMCVEIAMNIPKIIANVALGKAANKIIGHKILDRPLDDKMIVGLGLGLSAMRLATKSVPGAMLIGTALVLTAYIRRNEADKISDTKISDKIDDDIIIKP